jgi:xeroderma pigmentosum group C-complementing protein
MSDEDDVEWEYEDESDAAEDGDGRGDSQPVAVAAGDDVGGGGFQSYSPGDEEDVDWEDADQPTEEPPESDDDATEQTVGDLNAVNWDHINSVLQREADKERGAATPKKRAAVRMTKDDKAHELALHKSHLLLLLAAQLRMNALCQSRVLRGVLLSLTVDSAFDFFAELADAEPLPYAVELLVRWFHGQFRLATEDDNDEDSRLPPTENTLLRIVFDRCGSPAELALLFTTLSRALGLRTRLTVAMDPIVVQRHSKAAELAVAAEAPLSATAKRKRSRRAAAIEKDEGTVTPSASSRSQWVWCEVFNPKTTQWIAVDAVHKVVNRPQDIEALRGKYLPLSYVVSVDADGYATDVSPRYVDRWSKVLPRRLANDWLLRSLQIMNHQVTTDDADLHAMRDAERTKLRQLTEAEEMPTSLEAFKKHHLYCLERHLGQVECVYPRKAVGLFKGHAVFLRRAVQTTRTWFQWRRLGREVRESEKDRPAKRLVHKSGNTANGDDTEVETRASGRALYGYWQTDEIEPPRVDGVTVPKNKYGNIELWSPAHLPVGAVHLQLPRIDKVAQQLGVDFAAAVVGFESRNGVNYPQFDGIVVADAVAETLLDAHAHVQQTVIEKAINKNQQLIVKRWERLVKRLLLKARLNDEYGEV